MSLREEMWKYEQITGESAEHVPIIKLGAFLDGYDMAIKTLKQSDHFINELTKAYSDGYKCGYSYAMYKITDEEE